MFYHLYERMNIYIEHLHEQLNNIDSNTPESELIRMKQFIHSQDELQQQYFQYSYDYLQFNLCILERSLQSRHRQSITFICGSSGIYVLGILINTIQLKQHNDETSKKVTNT
jgi:hypothetical protein